MLILFKIQIFYKTKTPTLISLLDVKIEWAPSGAKEGAD